MWGGGSSGMGLGGRWYVLRFFFGSDFGFWDWRLGRPVRLRLMYVCGV